MGISKIRANKKITIDTVLAKTRPPTTRENMVSYANTRGGRDFTLKEFIEEYPESTRRTVEKVAVELVKKGDLKSDKCRCGHTNTFEGTKPPYKNEWT